MSPIFAKRHFLATPCFHVGGSLAGGLLLSCYEGFSGSQALKLGSTSQPLEHASTSAVATTPLPARVHFGPLLKMNYENTKFCGALRDWKLQNISLVNGLLESSPPRAQFNKKWDKKQLNLRDITQVEIVNGELRLFKTTCRLGGLVSVWGLKLPQPQHGISLEDIKQILGKQLEQNQTIQNEVDRRLEFQSRRTSPSSIDNKLRLSLQDQQEDIFGVTNTIGGVPAALWRHNRGGTSKTLERILVDTDTLYLARLRSGEEEGSDIDQQRLGLSYARLILGMFRR